MINGFKKTYPSNNLQIEDLYHNQPLIQLILKFRNKITNLTI